LEEADMKAAETICMAKASGIRLGVEGTDLVLDADLEPPTDVVDAIKYHKAGIIELLSPSVERWNAEDWQAFYDERAGIAEHDGRQTREQAESTAFECCVVEWLNRHPEPSQPDCCAWCSKLGTECSIVPFLAGDAGHTWLHPECWEDWYQARQREAVAALDRLGIKAG
jgi:hypothetical protein